MSEWSPRKAHISLHLGAHKTASTHLQHTLKANSALLQEAGVKFRGPSDLREVGESLLNRLASSPNSSRAKTTEVERQVASLFGGARRLVLSDENLLGPLWREKNGQFVPPLYPRSDSQLEKLIPCLGDGPLSLFLAIRNPADFIASAYTQALLGGRIDSFEDFSRELVLTKIRWFNVVRRLSLIPEVTEIYVWRYEDYPANIIRVMRKMVGWKLGLKVEPISKRVHPGLSAKAVEQVLAYDSASKDRFGLCQMARSARNEFPITDANPRFSPWDAASIKLADSAYSTDCAEIAKLAKVRMIHPWRPRK